MKNGLNRFRLYMRRHLFLYWLFCLCIFSLFFVGNGWLFHHYNWFNIVAWSLGLATWNTIIMSEKQKP